MSPFPDPRASAEGDQREASGQRGFVRAAPGRAKAMFQIFGKPESMPHNHAIQIAAGFFSFFRCVLGISFPSLICRTHISFFDSPQS